MRRLGLAAAILAFCSPAFAGPAGAWDFKADDFAEAFNAVADAHGRTERLRFRDCQTSQGERSCFYSMSPPATIAVIEAPGSDRPGAVVLGWNGDPNGIPALQQEAEILARTLAPAADADNLDLLTREVADAAVHNGPEFRDVELDVGDTRFTFRAEPRLGAKAAALIATYLGRP